MSPIGCTLYKNNLQLSYPAIVSACAANGGGLVTAAGPQDVAILANFTVALNGEDAF